ncbi:peptidoglycan-recognition protein SB2-like isoform X3 [Macrosteles quadrilineatus]|uniref:peptidoglycan-recognition protein SB2-like isoform X3 n=1 Tax=Macrosteles quadrilineatus TaxID=74068 RepID=UPI0023E09A64|nr:peptidoglycan-recognition protein SB2-like isoform X3 [Macrosteles quadrilineatus]
MVLHFTEECIVKRSEWGAKDATGPLDVLQHPVKEVLLTYTGTNICTTAEECRQFARELQEEYQKHNLKDIGPNFMIGGDGFVYEGRGWNFAPEQHPCAPQLHGKALEIAHFGCKGVLPPLLMEECAWRFIKYCVDQGDIGSDYRFYRLYNIVPIKKRAIECVP